MFGYVRPLKGEMKVKEYEEYKAVYCTLCRETGRLFGRRMRLALNYDLTFYTILALACSGAKASVRKGRCPVNPTKRCSFVCEGEEAYRKGAALMVLMSYHKLCDTIADESWVKRVGARIARCFASGPAKKAAATYPFMAQTLQTMMEEQEAAEKSPQASVDSCSDPTAKALSVIFRELGQGEREKELVLSELGYFLGRWIYLMDAADDLKEDLKNGSFNPLIGKLHLTGMKEILPDLQKKVDLECNEMLNFTVSRINSALNLLSLGRYRNIIENVCQLGLAEVQREILFLHIREKKKKQIEIEERAGN